MHTRVPGAGTQNPQMDTNQDRNAQVLSVLAAAFIHPFSEVLALVNRLTMPVGLDAPDREKKSTERC